MHTRAADLRIELTNDGAPAVYQEGDLVTGLVQVNVKEDIAVTEVVVEIFGVALVHHDGLDDEDLDEWGIPKIHTNKETYLEKKTSLIMAGESDLLKDSNVLNSGQYALPFSFKLPQKLPSSFEGSYGHISYWVQGTLERPSKPIISGRSTFRVISGLNLNLIPGSVDKIEICKHKSVSGFCCTKAGSVTIDWNVSKSGFVQGEDIFIHGAVQNDSKESVLYSKAILMMVSDYRTKKGKRREHKHVALIEKGETDSGAVTVWQDTITVPPVPSTTYGKSKIIDVYYQLWFSAMIETQPYNPVEVVKDIYIGTEFVDIALMRALFQVSTKDIPETVNKVQKVDTGSVDTLTKVIAFASVSGINPSPTAPEIAMMEEHDDMKLAEEGKGDFLERDPPFAPPSPAVQESEGVPPALPTAPANVTIATVEASPELLNGSYKDESKSVENVQKSSEIQNTSTENISVSVENLQKSGGNKSNSGIESSENNKKSCENVSHYFEHKISNSFENVQKSNENVSNSFKKSVESVRLSCENVSHSHKIHREDNSFDHDEMIRDSFQRDENVRNSFDHEDSDGY